MTDKRGAVRKWKQGLSHDPRVWIKFEDTGGSKTLQPMSPSRVHASSGERTEKKGTNIVGKYVSQLTEQKIKLRISRQTVFAVHRCRECGAKSGHEEGRPRLSVNTPTVDQTTKTTNVWGALAGSRPI